MAVTTPPAVTALPTPPSTSSPSTFDSRADAFLGALPALQTEMDALADNVFDNATDAEANATAGAASAAAALASENAAAASAIAAAQSAGASVWVSGTTYAIGDRRYSPGNSRVYVRKTVGAGTTDPASDSTNWSMLDISQIIVPVAGATVTVLAGATWSLDYAGAVAATLDAAIPDSGEFGIKLANGRTDNTLDIGAKTLYGSNGQTLTGIVTFDTQIRLWTFKYTAATTSLEIK
jgi:hypothetical protein